MKLTTKYRLEITSGKMLIIKFAVQEHLRQWVDVKAILEDMPDLALHYEKEIIEIITEIESLLKKLDNAQVVFSETSDTMSEKFNLQEPEIKFEITNPNYSSKALGGAVAAALEHEDKLGATKGRSI